MPDGSFGAVVLTQGLEQLRLIAADGALMLAHSSAELTTCADDAHTHTFDLSETCSCSALLAVLGRYSCL